MLSANTEKKLFLLDAYALIYRAYFAFSKNPRINSLGQNTSAAFGFTNVLIDIIKNEKPTHIAVVFDPPGGSVQRQEDFQEYKANREAMPEDIRSMIPPIKELIRAFNIEVIEVAGYEADDVVGSLSVLAEKNGFTTYMMTPDKDYAQLVTPSTFIYKPGRGGAPPQILGVKEVCEKFEITNPLQVIDILGLWGDASDNIPGIPGIGEKTSKLLISKYGSMEGIFENVEDLKGKQKENVIAFKDQGLMSKKLATIIIDIDLEFDENKLLLKELDREKIKNIFTELEFRNLSKRVLGEDLVIEKKAVPVKKETISSSSPTTSGQLDLFGVQSMIEPSEPKETSSFKTIVTENGKYHLVSDTEQIQELISILNDQDEVCFDTETTSLEARHAELVGVSFCFKNKEAYYVPIAESENIEDNRIQHFKTFFSNPKILKIGHNLKYDIKVLNRYGISVSKNCFDTMIAHYLINPEARQSMDFLAEFYLEYKTISIADLIGKKGKNQKNMKDLSPEQVCDYACEDADITFQLKKCFEEEIAKPHLKSLFYDVEIPLMFVLKNMENEGIALDVPALNLFGESVEKDLVRLADEITKIAGETFNIDSPRQLGEILFDKLKISSKAKKTKTGQYATSEDVLVKHRKDHPIVESILEYRQLKKLKSTYIDPLPELCDVKDGRIHTHFMQTVTATGRLSSNNPNLQNIPIRSAKGREIRKAFVAKNENHQLMAVDYSQIELRIIAALSEDKAMIEAFSNGVDIHTSTAAKVFKTPVNEVSREQRSKAKAVNFGIIYGQSAFGLSQNLSIPRKEAKAIIDSYFEEYPTIKKYMENVVAHSREKGYVETILKRRRYLPDINSSNAIVRGYAERNAVNAPVQGSAADVIKLAMIKVQNEMDEKDLKSKMVLQVHDELIFDVLEDEREVMEELVKKNMESAVVLSVPLDVEYKIANNWLEAH
ncbi:DNA polymerase I [Crocinitomicaceae bacterium]|nr:DNA polymerase I [Crocinitomicaceae bacterium]